LFIKQTVSLPHWIFYTHSFHSFAENRGRDFASLKFTMLRLPKFPNPKSDKILRVLRAFFPE